MKYYVMFFIVFMASYSNEQGASIVYDPTNGAAIEKLLSTLTKLKDSSEEWKSNAAFLNKIMNDGKEVKRLFSMLESIVCATDEMQIYIGLNGNAMVCEEKLEIDMTLLKIESISDKANLIVAGTMVLSQYETIKSLSDLNDELEDAIHQVNNLNRSMKRSFDKWIDRYDAQNLDAESHPFHQNLNI